jgi:hypothetical protein
MNTRQAQQIRQGIIAAREIPAKTDRMVLLNSRYYSDLAVRAFNRERRSRIAEQSRQEKA